MWVETFSCPYLYLRHAPPLPSALASPEEDGADLKMQKLEDGEAVADGAAGEGAEGGAEASAEVAGGGGGERTDSERLSTREEATPATPAPAPAAEAAEAAAGGGGECLDIVAPEGAAPPESPPWQDISLPTSPHISPYLPISPTPGSPPW